MGAPKHAGADLGRSAADNTLHGYDVSSEPETGLGKLVFRRRLDESTSVQWLSVSATLPLVLLGCDDAVRVLDIHGDLLAKMGVSPDFVPQPVAIGEDGEPLPAPPPPPRTMHLAQIIRHSQRRPRLDDEFEPGRAILYG